MFYHPAHTRVHLFGRKFFFLLDLPLQLSQTKTSPPNTDEVQKDKKILFETISPSFFVVINFKSLFFLGTYPVDTGDTRLSQ